MFKNLMARKDTKIEDEYNVPADEVVEETTKPLKPLFKKNPVQSAQDQQVTIVTENQLILQMLNNLNAKVDEILEIAKQ